MKEEYTPVADTAKGDEVAQNLGAFVQCEGISGGPGTPRLDESNEGGPFVIGNGHGHSTGVDGVPELTAGVADWAGKELFQVQLRQLKHRFIFPKNALETHNAAVHGPLHVVDPRGSIQIIIHMHMVGSGYDGIIDGRWGSRIELVWSCRGKRKVGWQWQCENNVIDVLGIVWDVVKALGILGREGFPISGNGFKVGRTGGITKRLARRDEQE